MTVAAVRFSGWATRERVRKKTAALEQALQAQGIETVATPVLNQYNPPWTLPFRRRNEITVQINWPATDS